MTPCHSDNSVIANGYREAPEVRLVTSGPRDERSGDASELLPGVTRDETGEAWGEESADDRDEELRREMPPHHG